MKKFIIVTLCLISIIFFSCAYLYYGCSRCEPSIRYCLGLYLIKPANELSTLFNFSDFVSSLALLAVLYTITNFKYKFRVVTASWPIIKPTYVVLIIVAIGTLITDVWFAQEWLVPACLSNQNLWQAFFGVILFSVVIQWIYFACIKPPIFSKVNYKKFSQELFYVILRSEANELKIVAEEISRSAISLIELFHNSKSHKAKNCKGDSEFSYCHDLLLLLGNKNLCRQIVATSPGTAIAFFEEMSKHPTIIYPLSQFARNISTEAIINTNSLFYHENDGYESGLLGYIKPFRKAVFGNYHLINNLGHHAYTPLQIDYSIYSKWTPLQFEGYCEAVLITFKDYLKKYNYTRDSQTINSAFSVIELSFLSFHKASNLGSSIYDSDEVEKLKVAVSFIKSAIILVDNNNIDPKPFKPSILHPRNIYDRISILMFKMIHIASTFKGHKNETWFVHYNLVWSNFFNYYEDNKTWSIILYKLRRLLYDEISRMKDFPNYKSARILSICLNVMGVKLKTKGSFGDSWYPLHKVLLPFLKRNYLDWIEKYPDVAETCITGSISYDAKNKRIVKTYAKTIKPKGEKEYLSLAR